MAKGVPRVGATRRVRVGTLSECISEGRIAFGVTYAHEFPFAFLMRNFALDEIGGFLGLRSGGDKQPRIGLDPCNPRLEIGGGVFNRLLFDSRNAAQHGSGHLRDEFLFRVGFRAKMSRVIKVLPVQALWVSTAVTQFVEFGGVKFFR